MGPVGFHGGVGKGLLFPKRGRRDGGLGPVSVAVVINNHRFGGSVAILEVGIPTWVRIGVKTILSAGPFSLLLETPLSRCGTFLSLKVNTAESRWYQTCS